MTEIGDRLIKLLHVNLSAEIPDNMSFTVDIAPTSGYHSQKWLIAVWDKDTLVQIRKCEMYVDNGVIWVDADGFRIAVHWFGSRGNDVYSYSKKDTPVQVVNAAIDYLLARDKKE